MDEWLTVGDEEFIAKSRQRLDSMVSESKILVLASHSRELVENLCNKAVLFENGRVKEFGEVGEVCRTYFG
jgi:lipopolysaccharide transport system ATP-binding protein